MAAIVELGNRELPADCFVFKHSTRCPISSAAAAFVRSHSFELPVYWLNVIEQRRLSDWVADAYGVRHESPQLLEIRAGAVSRVLNHYDIREERVRAARG
jgi:bacillithiol system protein YtxJ